MTKQELEELHSRKCVVSLEKYKRPQGDEVRYVIAMSLTAGEYIALENNLSGDKDEVSKDVHSFIINGYYLRTDKSK